MINPNKIFKGHANICRSFEKIELAENGKISRKY